MNRLALKLDLACKGYSLDGVGLLTYALNKRLNISESKVRELLDIPLNEGRFRDSSPNKIRPVNPEPESDFIQHVSRKDLDLIHDLMDHIPAVTGTYAKPPQEDIQRFVASFLNKTGIQSNGQKLANFIYTHWNKLQRDDEILTSKEEEFDENEHEALFKQLNSVPKIGRRNTNQPELTSGEKSFRNHANSFSKMPRPLSDEPPSTVSSFAKRASSIN